MSHILIVDDEADIRAFLRQILEGAGHSVSEAADGLAALQALGQRRTDVMLLDIRMPRHDGLETIRHLRRRHERLPIIAMSGADLDNSDLLDMALEFGADEIVQKPFRRAQLVGLIAQMTVPKGG
jgi:CheY-like chemotaxis protein